MKYFKELLIFMVAVTLFFGCQKKREEAATEGEAAPTQLEESPHATEIPEDVDIGAAHTTAAAATEVEAGSITKPEGGYTVEEIFTKSAELSDKEVSIRGKVVKFNSGIMGSNWLHLQDGTGSAGTDDLTVTTQAVVNVGDTVTITGKLSTDKDFGAGYKYAVIVEDANIATE